MRSNSLNIRSNEHTYRGNLSRRRSKNTGQAFISIVMLVALVIIPGCGFLSFEIGRLYLAKQQLQNASDAAALAAVATLASEDNSSPTQAHIDAMQAALKIFKANFVLGTQLQNSVLAASKFNAPAAGAATIFFEFVNPITMQVEPISSPNAKIVRAYTDFGAAPAFGRYLGLGTYTVSAETNGEVPQLDIELCFDVSGSMDDQTRTTFVKRKWDSALGKIVYDVQTGNTGLAQGKIFDVTGAPKTGSSVNGMLPQNLELAVNVDAANTPYLYFSEAICNPGEGLRALGGMPEQGKPPGNFPPGTAPTWDGTSVFTDLVVNIDGNDQFQGFTYKGYKFPDRATLVEASRGNLENNTVFSQSQASTAVTVSPQAGYQQAYWEAAAMQLQPIKDSKDAALLFTNILNTDTDCHFGFVTFDDTIGTNANDTEAWYSEDIDTPYGPLQNFPLPMVPLDPTAGNSNYSVVNGAINSVVSLGATNIGACIHQSVQELKQHKRPHSVRAIVLFTDGEPTAPGGPLDNDPKTNARKAALEAQAEGIPVYTIGLAQNPAIIPDEQAILNDTNNDPTTGGIAAIAGHGGTFNLVTDSSQLRKAFETIARHLVQLVATGN